MQSIDFNFFGKTFGGNYVFCCSSHINFSPTSHLKHLAYLQLKTMTQVSNDIKDSVSFAIFEIAHVSIVRDI